MFFSNFMNNIPSNTDPLNFLAIITAAIISLIIFRKDTSITFSKERHDKLIFPLFDILEPILYQKLDTDVLDKALDIISQNKNLADGKLIELHYLCSTEPSQENFNLLCSYIDRTYDRSCRKLMLKRRSILYRINRSQYKSKAHFILQLSIYVFFSFAAALVCFLLILCLLTSLVLIYDSLESPNKIFILLPLACILALIVKFFSRGN